MLKINLLNLFTWLIALFLFSTCSNKNSCESHLMGSISEIDYADTLHLGGMFTYHFKVAGFNGCSSLESITAKQTGKSIVITGNIYNNGCTCSMLYPFFNGTYVFIPDSIGTYYLNFVNDLHEKYLTDTVEVIK